MSIPTLFVLTLGLALAADTGSTSKDDKPVERKPHPFAPSLPLMTDEEEKQFDAIIDRFIQFDIGKLTGDDGKKAKADFDKLGPEATFALVRGLNRAAKIEGSCPALIISKKLATFFAVTEDRELLEFARDNIGAGVQQSRHSGMLSDLRTSCMLRKNALTRAGIPNPPPYGGSSTSTLSKLGVTELANTGTTGKLTQAKQAVLELAGRNGDEALGALASVATTVSDPEVKKAARDGLEKALGRLSQSAFKEKLKDRQFEMRAASARVIGIKNYRLGVELIDLLEDENADVRDAAHKSLVRLAGGKTDFGPEASSDTSARTDAVKQWRAWWATQKR